MLDLTDREQLQQQLNFPLIAEIQELPQFAHVDVGKVYKKLLDRYGNIPTVATLIKWLATEKDPASLRGSSKSPAPARRDMPRDPNCQQCDGTGFVKAIRIYNGVQVVGRLQDSVTGGLVRCDHQTAYVDSRHGAEVKPEDYQEARY